MNKNLHAHRTPKRFSMDGLIGDDADFGRLREQYETLLIHQMRESGYIPTLDFGPLFSTRFVEEKGHYEFVLSLYGIFVGKENASLYEGFDGNGHIYKKG